MSNSLVSVQAQAPVEASGLSRAVFESWILKNHRALSAYARALVDDPDTAKELTQDALVVAWRFRDRFDLERGELGSWVRGILRNKWRELGRKRKLELLEEGELEAIEAMHRSWEEAGNEGRGELIERVSACVGKLPEAMQEAVKGTYFQGWSGPELAERLAVSQAALRKRLERVSGGDQGVFGARG